VTSSTRLADERGAVGNASAYRADEFSVIRHTRSRTSQPWWKKPPTSITWNPLRGTAWLARRRRCGHSRARRSFRNRENGLPDGWDSIPGARGCTPEACGFRDHYQDLLAAGADGVFGLSSQETDYQREVVERLHLPFQMLSDPARSLAQELSLPTFVASGLTLYKRLTLIIRDGVVEQVFYPIFPPNEHADQVLTWLRDNPL
jgi:peroxiredoxin